MQVQVEPVSERCLRERGSVRQVIWWSLDLIEKPVRASLFAVLDHCESQLHSELLKTVDLARDEDFRQARVTLQNVCDCPLSCFSCSVH